MNNKTKINYAIVIFFLLIIYLIKSYAFNKGYPTCENYVTNTYLYLALSICYIYLNILYFKDYKQYTLLAFVLGIFLLIYMNMIFPKTKEGIFTNHFIWFAFLTCLSFMIIPAINVSSEETIKFALAVTFGIFLFMSVIVYIFPKFFEKTFGYMYPALFLSLLMIILVELYFIFIAHDYPESVYRYISYFVIVLFSLYVSYDTKLMFIESKLCRKYANYPKSSLKFILDVVNIFVRTLSISNR